MMMNPIVSGSAIRQVGQYPRGTLGGWFCWSKTGSPVFLTVAHILASWELRTAESQTHQRLAELPRKPAKGEKIITTNHEKLDIALCTTGEVIGRVVATGYMPPFGRFSSLDVAIAQPISPQIAQGEFPGIGWQPRIAEAVVGHRVMKVSEDAGMRHGVVVATDWDSNQYGSRRDMLIAPAIDEPFSTNGDSGALIWDVETRSIVGLHYGRIKNRAINGTQHPLLGCAHHIGDVFRLFDLVLLN